MASFASAGRSKLPDELLSLYTIAVWNSHNSNQRDALVNLRVVESVSRIAKSGIIFCGANGRTSLSDRGRALIHDGGRQPFSA